MIECMNMALNAAVEGGADIALLGGQRQRYGYFGFEPGGIVNSFFITETNLRHHFGKGTKSGWLAREITDVNADSQTVDEIIALNTSLPFYPVRPKANYVDIMRTWNKKLYAAFDGEEFKGYFVTSKHSSVNEFMPVNNDDAARLLLCCFETAELKSCNIRVPLFNRPLAQRLVTLCEDYSLDCLMKVSIFNYQNIIEGFLKVKAQTVSLPDGSLTLLIHGCVGDERLCVTVKDNAVTVEKTTKKPDIELTHNQAIRFVCAPFSSERDCAAPFIREWFPVPFFCYSCDDV